MSSSRRTWAQSNSVSRRTPALWLCHLILKSLQHVQSLWKIAWIFLKKTKNIWSDNPTLGIHLEKMKTPIWKDTITPMFIATLCIIAKKWKKPVSTDRWMDKDVIHIYIYDQILLSHKKEWNNVICSNMNGPRDYYTTSKKDTYHMIPLKSGI